MPLRKRTHTTASDRFPVHDPGRLDQLRRMIAAEAARIMVTQAQSNYRIAKQKAAQRLGAGANTSLPSNLEVEKALRAYQQFYGGEQHLVHLQKLRRIALQVMQSLEPFQPRLVGPVLDGTADEHSRISLHLFNDPPDAVAIYLMDKGLAFYNEQRKIRWHDGGHRQVPLLVTDREDAEIELVLLNCLDLRQAPPSPVDGRPQKRAGVVEVECLLAGV
ncbi:MAG: hypothetical protein OQJ84_07785 [Xanthomonadales bacterium]|nr:hypothetical protein [Xanthomonadales bacterium]